MTVAISQHTVLEMCLFSSFGKIRLMGSVDSLPKRRKKGETRVDSCTVDLYAWTTLFRYSN